MLFSDFLLRVQLNPNPTTGSWHQFHVTYAVHMLTCTTDARVHSDIEVISLYSNTLNYVPFKPLRSYLSSWK